jgi:APA family basic amino acid/polyamine antiporter
VSNLFGKSFESILSVLISFALLSSLSAFIILGPRVYYSMAKDGYFFKFASKVHSVYRVPSKSILLQIDLYGFFSWNFPDTGSYRCF